MAWLHKWDIFHHSKIVKLDIVGDKCNIYCPHRVLEHGLMSLYPHAVQLPIFLDVDKRWEAYII